MTLRRSIMNALMKEAALERTFPKGVELYRFGGARVNSVRREAGFADVDGIVSGSRGAEYGVSLVIDERENELVEYECTCPAAAKYSGMCKHAVALGLEYLDLASPDDAAGAGVGAVAAPMPGTGAGAAGAAGAAPWAAAGTAVGAAPRAAGTAVGEAADAKAHPAWPATAGRAMEGEGAKRAAAAAQANQLTQSSAFVAGRRKAHQTKAQASGPVPAPAPKPKLKPVRTSQAINSNT